MKVQAVSKVGLLYKAFHNASKVRISQLVRHYHIIVPDSAVI